MPPPDKILSPDAALSDSYHAAVGSQAIGSASDKNYGSSSCKDKPTGALQTQVPAETKGYHSLSHAYETYLSRDREELNHWEDVCRAFR